MIAILTAIGAGIYFLDKYYENNEKIIDFYLFIAYCVIGSIYLGAIFVVLKMLALNAFLYFFPEIEFDELRIPLLIVVFGVSLLFLFTLIFLLPLEFSEL